MKIINPYPIKSRHDCFSAECSGRTSTHIMIPIRHGIKIGLYYICERCREAIFWGEAYKKNAGLYNDSKGSTKK